MFCGCVHFHRCYNITGFVVVRDEEFQALLLLKSQNTAQKDQIKELKSNMRATKAESEDLKRHIERLFSQNYELVRKNKSLQKQCKSLIRERLDLVEKGNYLQSVPVLMIFVLVESMEEDSLRLQKTLQQTSQTCRDLENQNVKKLDNCIFILSFLETSRRFNFSKVFIK